MTLMSDVEKMRLDLERIAARVDANTNLAASHEQQISGERGITDTLQRLADEMKNLHADIAAMTEKLVALEAAFARWTAVAKALAEKTVSTRVFVMGIIALLIPVIALIVSQGVK